MPATQFLPFAIESGANIISQATYAAADPGFRGTGFEDGIADPQELNKVWRQSAFGIAAFTQFIVNVTGQDVLDDGVLANLIAQIGLAVGGSVKPARLITASSTLTILTSDSQIGFNRTAAVTAMTANLPAMTTDLIGKQITLQDLVGNFGANNVTVVPNGSDTIAGMTSFVLNVNRQSATFTYYGSNLWGIAK
jgi:hypothetical protein